MRTQMEIQIKELNIELLSKKVQHVDLYYTDLVYLLDGEKFTCRFLICNAGARARGKKKPPSYNRLGFTQWLCGIPARGLLLFGWCKMLYIGLSRETMVFKTSAGSVGESGQRVGRCGFVFHTALCRRCDLRHGGEEAT